MLKLPSPFTVINAYMNEKRSRLVGIYGSNAVNYLPFVEDAEESWCNEIQWLFAVTYTMKVMDPREMDLRGYPLAADFEENLRLGQPMIVGLVGKRVMEHRRSGVRLTAEGAFLHAWNELRTTDAAEIQRMASELFVVKL